MDRRDDDVLPVVALTASDWTLIIGLIGGEYLAVSGLLQRASGPDVAYLTARQDRLLALQAKLDRMRVAR